MTRTRRQSFWMAALYTVGAVYFWLDGLVVRDRHAVISLMLASAWTILAVMYGLSYWVFRRKETRAADSRPNENGEKRDTRFDVS